MTSDENFNAMLDMIFSGSDRKGSFTHPRLGRGDLTLNSEDHGVFSSLHSLTWPWVVKVVLAELLESER